MKGSYSKLVPLVFGIPGMLLAQNFEAGRLDSPLSADSRQVSPLGHLPAIDRAQGLPVSEGALEYTDQDLITLESLARSGRKVESAVNLDVLRHPSAYRNVASGIAADGFEVPTGNLKQELAIISATYRESGTPEKSCQYVSLSVGQRVKMERFQMLEIVEAEMLSNPSCSCEIVKAAIQASDANTDEVVSIVEISINAVPEMMRVVSQCAIAAAPESLGAVQALMARYDSNAGDPGYGAKSAKSAKSAKAPMDDEVAALPNPLDFPGAGPVGPTPGGPGGQPLIPPNPPIIIVVPVTRVDP